MPIQDFIHFVSTETKFSLVLDVLKKDSQAAIKAFNELIVDEDKKQLAMMAFSRRYMIFLSDGVNHPVDDSFKDNFLEQLKNSFKILMKANPSYDYNQYSIFVNDYKINKDILKNINYMISFTDLIETKNQINWLESLINQVGNLEDVIQLNEKSLSILKEHFSSFSSNVQIGYLTKTNGYHELKPLIKNAWNENTHAYLMDLEPDEAYEDSSDYDFSVQLIVLALQFNSLDKRIIEDAIAIHSDGTTHCYFDDKLMKNLVSSEQSVGQKMLTHPQLMEEKIQLLEKQIEFSYSDFCQQKVDSSIKELLNYFADFNSEQKIEKLIQFCNYYQEKNKNNEPLFYRNSLVYNADTLYSVCEFKLEHSEFLHTLLSLSDLSEENDNLFQAYHDLLIENKDALERNFSNTYAQKDENDEVLIQELLINLETMALNKAMKNNLPSTKSSKMKL